jgi:hypothetical protein
VGATAAIVLYLSGQYHSDPWYRYDYALPSHGLTAQLPAHIGLPEAADAAIRQIG